MAETYEHRAHRLLNETNGRPGESEIADMIRAAVEEEREACARDCDETSAAILKEANRASQPETRVRFMAMARAHEMDATEIRARKS